jgi:hypothetical protein
VWITVYIDFWRMKRELGITFEASTCCCKKVVNRGTYPWPFRQGGIGIKRRKEARGSQLTFPGVRG